MRFVCRMIVPHLHFGDKEVSPSIATVHISMINAIRRFSNIFGDDSMSAAYILRLTRKEENAFNYGLLLLLVSSIIELRPLYNSNNELLELIPF